MKTVKSFVEKYQYVEKEKDFKDDKSLLSPTYLVGGFPLNKMIHLKGYHQELEKYGIPAGLVMIPNHTKQLGGSSTIISEKKGGGEKKCISDTDFDCLFNIHCKIDSQNKKTKKNTTKKNTTK